MKNLTYKIDFVHYGTKGVQHSNTGIMFYSDIAALAKNIDVVNLAGVNNLVIDTDAGRVIQAGGYSADRGAFCDLY